MMTMGCAAYVAPEMAGHFRHNAMFIGANVREAINDGRADYTPDLSERNRRRCSKAGQMPIDVALIQVSPPDSHGFCSFGVGVDTTLTAAKCARYVVAQVNDQMPRTYGDSFIHVSDIDAIVEVVAAAVRTAQAAEITDLHVAIARNVAGLIEDGCRAADRHRRHPRRGAAVLMDRKDLGVHSELVSDGVIPLIEAGVIDRRAQELQAAQDHPGLRAGHAASCSTSWTTTRSSNSIPRAYTNDPILIARNDNMVAINSALQVDLTGQVCSDSIGNQFYSGIGGQVDFLRGALAFQGRQADHRAAFDGEERHDLAHRAHARSRRGSGDLARAGALRGHRVRRGLPARQDRFGERAKALIEIAHPNSATSSTNTARRTKWLQQSAAAQPQCRGEKHGRASARQCRRSTWKSAKAAGCAWSRARPSAWNWRRS